MANIKLDVDTLTAQANSMNSLAEELLAIQKKLENELTATNANWSSGISSSFSNTISSMKTVFVEMIQELNDNAKRAEAVAYKYKEADGSIKSVDISGLSDQETIAILDEKNKIYNYNGSKYKCILTASQLDAIKKKQSTSVNCTSTAWAMGKQITTGKSANPDDYWGDNGCTWGGEAKASYKVSTNDAIKLAYDEVASGKPCVVHTPNKYNSHLSSKYEHAVTVVGVKEGVDRNSVTASDLLVLDPADGQVKTWDKVGYKANQVFNVHRYN